MKSHMLVLFLCLSPFVAFNQMDINQQDDNGKKFGKWEGRWPNGSLRYEGRFHHDKPVGLFKYYYEDGKLRAVNEFDSDGLKAKHKAYSKSGVLVAEGIYFDQKKDSVWCIYSDADGVLLAKETYQDNQLNGLTVIYFPGKQQPAEETFFKNGLRHGKSVKFYDNGSIMSVTHFAEDLPDGPFAFYFENGSKQIEGVYRAGMKTGKWISWDDQGNVLSEESYKDERQ